jgi:ATP-dependent RNA helicase RhlE
MSDTAVTPSTDTPTFDQFGLSADILRAVTDSGYTTPTPIQAQAIPVVLAGRDVMGAAQTGTGKTASFSLPIIQRLLPQAYAKHTPLRSAVVFGGVDMNPQSAELRRGVEILIATPGRLLDHVQQKTANLGQVQILVLDEADRMLDMGFLPDLQRILNLLPKERQTLLFSATFSGEIKKLAATYLRNPQTIEVARSNSTATNVTQIVFEVAEGDKTGAVVQLIRERSLKQVLVFCNSKIGASRLARQLERDGVVATAIHGDRTQNERMQALDAFKRGEIEALVATDVAARGLDIVELPTVINFDLPFSAEDYVHRIGRTGRAGASGDALSLCSPNERKQLADIEKLIKRPLDVQRLTVDVPVRHHHEERGGRRERDERPGRRRPTGGSSYDRPHHHRHAQPPVDDFFLKPYEPSPSSKKLEDEAPAAPQKPASRQPLAALLGGFGMPRKTPTSS